MNWRVSTIIPLCNGEKYIQQAIESVIAQTLKPLELIIVNDGSTDNSVALIETLVAPFPIKLIHQANAGQSAARNHAARIAAGELLAFLDQDDFWYPNHLERLVAPFQSKPRLGWAYSDVDEIDQKGRLVTLNLLTTLPTKHPKRSLIDLLGEDMFILPSASVVLKSAFAQIKGFDEQLSGSEDDDLFLRLFQASYTHEFCPEALSQWRVRYDSASYTQQSAASNDRYARKLLETFHDEPLLARYYRRDCIAPRFYNLALEQYKKFLILGQWEDCLKELENLKYYNQMFAQNLSNLIRHNLKHWFMAYPSTYLRIARVYSFFLG